MVLWEGALLSVVSNFLVNWLSRESDGPDTIILDILQYPFNSNLAMSPPPGLLKPTRLTALTINSYECDRG